jgi:hypothetical protein
MEKAGAAWRRRLAIRALPCVESNVVMIAARGEKGAAAAIPLRQLKAEHIPVKSNRALQIRDLEMDMSDACPRINCAVIHPAVSTCKVVSASESVAVRALRKGALNWRSVSKQ